MTNTPMDAASGRTNVTYVSMDPLTSTVGSSQVLAYVERLASRGVDVDLVTFEHGVDVLLRQRLGDLGVSWRPKRFGRPGPVGGIGRVLRAAWAIRDATLVHARSDLAAAAVMLSGVDDWVWDVRSLWVDQKVASGVIHKGSWSERVMTWVECQAAHRSTAVVTLTASAVAELDRRYGGVVSPKARVITTCVDLDKFYISPMPPMPLRVLLSGTLNRYYDVKSMLDLIIELRSRRPVEFVLASPGEIEWEEELAGVEVVRISVAANEMADLVATCHLGLSVCRDDAGVSLLAAMPTKIGEFLASGRPVVVNQGLIDAVDLLEHHECGMAYGSSSPFGVGEAVDQLELILGDSELPGRCRSLAESHFNLDRGVEGLIVTLESICMNR